MNYQFALMTSLNTLPFTVSLRHKQTNSSRKARSPRQRITSPWVLLVDMCDGMNSVLTSTRRTAQGGISCPVSDSVPTKAKGTVMAIPRCRMRSALWVHVAMGSEHTVLWLWRQGHTCQKQGDPEQGCSVQKACGPLGVQLSPGWAPPSTPALRNQALLCTIWPAALATSYGPNVYVCL